MQDRGSSIRNDSYDARDDSNLLDSGSVRDYAIGGYNNLEVFGGINSFEFSELTSDLSCGGSQNLTDSLVIKLNLSLLDTSGESSSSDS